MIIKVILLSIALVAVAFLLLGVKVLFVKGGRFPSGHVHDSEAMKKRGITCAHGHDSASQSTH